MNFRRPSIPTAIAVLALFVALDGPAHAERLINGKLLRKGTVTSRAIKDRTIQARDLSRPAYRDLKAVRNDAITSSKLAPGAVTANKLATGAVGASAIADRSVGADRPRAGAVGAAQLAPNSVGGGSVVDGSLAANDLARFYGRFTMPSRPCPGAPAGPAPRPGSRPSVPRPTSRATSCSPRPDSRWADELLTFTMQNDGNVSRFVIQACNLGARPAPAFEAGVRYMVIDLP